MDEEALQKLRQAKVMIARDMDLFSAPVIYMRGKKLKEFPKDFPHQTMAVDARGNYYYNSEFIKFLSSGQLRYVIKHEILHTLLRHVHRTEKRHGHIWNIAVDVKVNDVLNNEYDLSKHAVGKDIFKQFFKEVPEENLANIIPDFNRSVDLDFGPNAKITIEKINEKSVEKIYEEIYNHLKKKNMIKTIKLIAARFGDGKKDKGTSRGGQSGEPQEGKSTDGDSTDEQEGKLPKSFDSHINNPAEVGEKPISKKEMEEIEREAKRMLVDAYTTSKLRGNLPEGVRRMIEDILEPKIDWRKVVQSEIQKEILIDWHYKKPHRRSDSVGTFLPSSVREGHEVVAAVDLSGSIGRQEMMEFLSELIGMAKQLPALKMTLLSHDVKIHSIHELTRATEQGILSAELKGGGGTSHQHVFKFMKEEKKQSRLLVCLTDLYSDIEQLEPPRGFRVVWVVPEHGAQEDPSFGRTVRL